MPITDFVTMLLCGLIALLAFLLAKGTVALRQRRCPRYVVSFPTFAKKRFGQKLEQRIGPRTFDLPR